MQSPCGGRLPLAILALGVIEESLGVMRVLGGRYSQTVSPREPREILVGV